MNDNVNISINTYRNTNLLNTGIVVSNVPANLQRIVGVNNAAALRFIKLYDQTTVPVATDIPVLTISLLASQPFNHEIRHYFRSGIGIRATTGLADNDNTAPTANDVLVQLFNN